MSWNENMFVLESNITQLSYIDDDFINGECFSVPSDEILTLKDIIVNWALEAITDEVETQSFVGYECFRFDCRRDHFAQNQYELV